MNTFLKVIIIPIVVVLYVISPIDFVPGPLDDLLVIILGSYLNKQLKRVSD